MGNERLIRKGEKEARRVVSYKQALRDARARQMARRKASEKRHGKRSVHLPFFDKRHYRTQYYTDGTVELHERLHPYMHYHHRTKPPHHGISYRIRGFLTRNAGMRDQGRMMRDVANRERAMARRRRRRELRQFGHAMRTKHRY
jgi:hypothetical protein